jgi:hypothetical protein
VRTRIASGGYASNFAVQNFIVIEQRGSGGVQISTLSGTVIKMNHNGSFTISLISW